MGSGAGSVTRGNSPARGPLRAPSAVGANTLVSSRRYRGDSGCGEVKGKRYEARSYRAGGGMPDVSAGTVPRVGVWAGAKVPIGVVTVPQVMTDAAVIAAADRDTEQFAVLYDRYAAGLYRYAYRRVGAEHAEDVVAETFAIAFRRRRTYDRSRPDARPWLYGIATKEIARWYRSEDARLRAWARSDVRHTEESPADRVAERVSASAARPELAEALRRLTPGDRDVLLLEAWGDLTQEQIAQTLGIRPGTARSRLHRARRQVRAALGAGATDELEAGR